jgi:hypothetical protein
MSKYFAALSSTIKTLKVVSAKDLSKIVSGILHRQILVEFNGGGHQSFV